MKSIDKYLQALGQAILIKRKEHHLLQAELGYDAQLNQNYVCEIEQGKKNITVDTIVRVAEALNIKPSTLFILAEQYLEVNI